MDIFRTLFTLLAVVIYERLKNCSASTVDSNYEVIFTDLERDVRKLKHLKIAVESLKKIRRGEGLEFKVKRSRRDEASDGEKSSKDNQKESLNKLILHFVKGLKDIYPEAATELYSELAAESREDRRRSKGGHERHCFHCSRCHHTIPPGGGVYLFPVDHFNAHSTSNPPSEYKRIFVQSEQKPKGEPNEDSTHRHRRTTAKTMTVTYGRESSHGHNIWSHLKPTRRRPKNSTLERSPGEEHRPTPDKRKFFDRCMQTKWPSGRENSSLPSRRLHRKRRKHRRTTTPHD